MWMTSMVFSSLLTFLILPFRFGFGTSSSTMIVEGRHLPDSDRYSSLLVSVRLPRMGVPQGILDIFHESVLYASKRSMTNLPEVVGPAAIFSPVRRGCLMAGPPQASAIAFTLSSTT